MKTRTIAALVAVIWMILWLAGRTAQAQTIGEIGVLRGAQGAGSVPVFTDDKALDAFYKANVGNDKEGVEELFNAGRLFMADVGTKVRVLSGGWSTMEIRILEGPFNGQRGFVSRQWVTESNPGRERSSTSADTSHQAYGQAKATEEEREELKKLQEEQKRLSKELKETRARWDKEDRKREREMDASGTTPTPTPKPKHTPHSRKQQTGPTGDPIYRSQPVSPKNSRKGSSSDWGTTWVLRNGQVPVYYGVYRRKEQIGLAQERQGEDNITSEQRELWRRMDRPFGVPYRSFITPDENGYMND
jgi:hypothetical protein